MLISKMGKGNKCLSYLCVGLVIFTQIISGLLQQVTLLPHLNKEHEHLNDLHKTTLHSCLLLNLTAIVGGFLLLFGVILRQPKLVLCHIVMTIVCSVVAIIYVIVMACLKKLESDLVYGSLLVTTAVYVFACCLESAVYFFYKDMFSEKDEEATELVTNECVE